MSSSVNEKTLEDGQVASVSLSDEKHGHHDVAPESQPSVLAEKSATFDDEYPEGGWAAWTTVLGAWIIQFSTYGYCNAFGVYEDFYVRDYMTDETSSTISWIGSVQVFMTTTIGIFSGALYDKGYFHHLLIFGSTLLCFSLFMLSLAHRDSFYQVFLSQAIGMGIGMGVTYIPSLGVVSHYFKRKRALVMGIVASGSSVGGVLHPIMLNNLFHSGVGFQNGARISAAFLSVLLIFANLIMRTRLPPASKSVGGSMGRWEAAKKFSHDWAYMITIAGTFFVACGMFFPIFYIQLIAIQHGISPTLAFYCITILNVASAVGRVVPNFLADKIGVFNMVILNSFATGIVCYGTVGIHSAPGLVMFALVFGFASGAYVSLIAPMVASTATSMNEIGQRFGIGFILTGIGGLIGAPIAGALLTTDYHWWKPTIWSGTIVMCGTVCFAIARFMFAKRRGTPYV